MLKMLPGFERQTIQTSGAKLNVVMGGKGPPLLLLHGYPQTNLEWRKVAPDLAKTYTVVMPDLRGYGDSEKLPGGTNHINYSKRAMAQDQVEVMRTLGFERFSMVGHDRGARVGHRLALDYPSCVSKLALLDICPTLHMYKTANRAFASGYYHWFLLIQPAPFPETLIGNSTEAFLTQFLGSLIPTCIEPEVLAEYVRCFDAATIHASCEDYRAGATIDLMHDEADLDVKISCPVLVLWGANGLVGRLYDVLAIWKERALNATGKGLPCTHWIPEEAPNETLQELRNFFGS